LATCSAWISFNTEGEEDIAANSFRQA